MNEKEKDFSISGWVNLDTGKFIESKIEDTSEKEDSDFVKYEFINLTWVEELKDE